MYAASANLWPDQRGYVRVTSERDRFAAFLVPPGQQQHARAPTTNQPPRQDGLVRSKRSGLGGEPRMGATLGQRDHSHMRESPTLPTTRRPLIVR